MLPSLTYAESLPRSDRAHRLNEYAQAPYDVCALSHVAHFSFARGVVFVKLREKAITI